MKKEELFETLSDLDPAMVKKGAGLSAFPRGCMEKMDGRGSLRGDHRRSCAGGLRHGEMDRRVRQSVTRRG